MLGWRSVSAAAFCIALHGAWPAPAAEQVGQAVLIKTEVTGQDGPIAVNGPVHRDERIRTSQSGLGQFIFRDGTRLAVGWGSSVVVDKYVFDDSQSVKKLTIRAAKGTFRWVSGNSSSSSYQILTPAGTIGVRGTAFDFYIGPDGTTAVVLLNGAARFCGAGGCRELQQRCDCVIARPNGNMTATRRVDRNVLRTLGNQRALPFLSGAQRLSGGLGMMGGCSLASVIQDRSDRDRPAPSPQAPAPDDPAPPPSPQPRGDPPQEKPEKPDKPSVPDKPGHPQKPDRPGHHDKPDKPDKPDKGKPDRDGPGKGKPGKGGWGRGPDKSGGPGEHAGKGDRPDRDDRSYDDDRHDRGDDGRRGGRDRDNDRDKDKGRGRDRDR
jgi:hypothetical protein